MKKIRELPDGYDPAYCQTPEYQARLRAMVAEPEQRALSKSFMGGRAPETGLIALDYETLESCRRPVPDNWGTKHSIWEEGDEACYSFGKLIFLGLIRLDLHTVKEGMWLLPVLTEAGELTLRQGGDNGSRRRRSPSDGGDGPRRRARCAFAEKVKHHARISLEEAVNITRVRGSAYYDSDRLRLVTTLQDDGGHRVTASLVDMGTHSTWVKRDSWSGIDGSWSPPEQAAKTVAEAAFDAHLRCVGARHAG